MMYKVLFADDEPIALEGIRMLADWEELGFEICGMCSNGEEAWDLIQSCRPDLVLTDIRMPVHDGLELIGRVRKELEEEYDPIFIIMSGYSDFDYARTALRYGVRHYLLKPVMDDEWESILKDILAELQERSREKNRKELLSRQLLPAVLSGILRGEEPDDTVSGQLEQLDGEAEGWTYIHLEGPKGTDLEVYRSQPSTSQMIVLDLSCRQVGIVVDGTLSAAQVADRAFQQLRSRGGDVRVSIGPSVRSLRDLALSYTGALEASIHHFFHTECGPVEYDTVMKNPISYDLQAMETVDKLLSAAERLQEQEVAGIIGQMFELFQERKTAPEVVRTLSVHVVLKSIEVLRELGASTEVWPEYRTFLETEARSLTEWEQSLRKYMTEYMGHLKVQKEAMCGHPLKSIERYIQENYRKTLTIKEIGELFFMNPVYLGQAFMKKNGIGIIETIHDLRIEEAKRLLRETDHTIRSIAEDIGYVHYHHFLREFEKRVSEKPAAYRQSARPKD